MVDTPFVVVSNTCIAHVMGKNLIFPTLLLLTIFPTGVHDTLYNDYADFQLQTRMHSSRMHTARSSSCWGGSGPDPPEFPTWMLAWT